MTMTVNKFLVPLFLRLLFLAILLVGISATLLCKVDTKELCVNCRPAVAPLHGKPLQPPTKHCCSVIRHADLKCLCNFKSILPSVGINTTIALALPSKCGINTPPECHGL
ncbi:putative lipid-transfer protein DIR1 [Benincasa hispida]|uniref:putative lipid-transfer protein DIR1 n=1 Tax=Benincasa hispida TaxID=102211 RepID=UPI0018FF82C9|nr:putative lipid-transfer protein DIR1 [Benincasa hispida]